MTPEQFDREKKYQAALAVARALLKNGVITEDDYDEIEDALRIKFCPFIGAFKPEKP
jgi:ferredoxin